MICLTTLHRLRHYLLLTSQAAVRLSQKHLLVPATLATLLISTLKK
jgi:hypothetical protein